MMVAGDTATTGQKTHRYLRLSLVFVVFTLLLSVLIQTIVVSWDPLELGWDLLPSISHYYYTPARTVFVGTLIAASLALLALSGRNRATTLLDISAIFAPLIAIIPTGIDPDQMVEGWTCPKTGDCVPKELLGDARTGVATYCIVVVVAVLVMYRIRKRLPSDSPSAPLVSWIAVGTAVVVAVLAFVPVIDEDFPFNFVPFPSSIHFAATLLFFGTFAAVQILHARSEVDEDETPPTPAQVTTYRILSGAMIVVLVGMVAAFLLRDRLPDFPLVLIGEALALCIFAAFWAVQTFQRWNDSNAPNLVPQPGSPS